MDFDFAVTVALARGYLGALPPVPGAARSRGVRRCADGYAILRWGACHVFDERPESHAL